MARPSDLLSGCRRCVSTIVASLFLEYQIALMSQFSECAQCTRLIAKLDD